MVVAARAASAHEKLAETVAKFFQLWRRGGPGKISWLSHAKLERTIREALKIPEGPLYERELGGLKKLDCSSMGVTDLSGIENCTGLECLYLSNNEISDIRCLADLRELRVLFLDGNQIEDISPLANLTRLGEWERGLGQPEDLLTRLAVLKEETEEREMVTVHLGLSNNQIRDISPLLNNPGIAEGVGVDLTGNSLSDGSVKNAIPQLERRGVKVLYDKPKGGSEE
jgi:Leucine-rich repeat (LRR) protein